MARVVNHHLLDRAALESLVEPRDDWVVAERRVIASNPASGDSYVFEPIEGPFTHWRREVEFTKADAATRAEVVETIDFEIAMPFWRIPFSPLVKWSLGRPQSADAPFWAPPQRLDQRGARSIALLIFAVLAAAYLGTLLSQTITFVADEFDKGTSTQGWVTSMTRGGALLALVVVRAGDRVGRRRMLLLSGAGSALFAASAAVSPNIWFFGAAETLSRGLATGFGILIGVFAAEESPAGSRAWVTSILALFAGLGSGMVLWLLPVAGIDERAWRILFVVALLVLPVLWKLSQQLEESRRFDALRQRSGDAAPISATMKRRFTMLAAVGFATALFAAPASNFQNEYLKEIRGFSPGKISLYSTAVSTPIGIGVAIAGPQADRRGRRIVGIIGLLGGVLFTVTRYSVAGPVMWGAGVLATVVGAATIPALGVYGPELFPTSRRGLANGLLTCVSVVGSVAGLLFVGYLSDQWGFGRTFAAIATLPLLAALVVARYPETAQKALEELNPEDTAPHSTAG